MLTLRHLQVYLQEKQNYYNMNDDTHCIGSTVLTLNNICICNDIIGKRIISTVYRLILQYEKQHLF